MNVQSPKGQTSFDFLMTYGWTIILIVVVVGGLFSIGVFNINSFIGPRTTGFAQLGVVSWGVNPIQVLSVKLENRAGYDVRVTKMEISNTFRNYSYAISNVSIPNGKTSDPILVGRVDLVPGQYYTIPLRITYTDLNGFNYTDTGTLSGTVGVDTGTPSLAILSPMDNAFVNSRTLPVSLMSTDDYLNFTIISVYNSTDSLVNSTTNSTNGAYTVYLDVPSDGIYSITATAYDTSGNRNASSVHGITVDTSPPAIYGLSSNTTDNVSRSDAILNFTITVDDTNLLGVSLNHTSMIREGGTDTYYIVDTASALGCAGDGPCTLMATATDLAGNSDSTDYILTIDDTSPTISIASPTDDTALGNQTMQVSFAASDTNYDHTIIIAYDSGNSPVSSEMSSSPSGTVTLSVQTDGVYSITATSYDKAGNNGSDTSINITIDTVPSSVIIQSPSGTYNSTSVDLNYTVTDSGSGVANCSYQFDSDPAVPEPACQNATLSNLSEGVHTMTVYSTDNAGNTNSTSTLFMIDSLPPSIAIFSPIDSTYYNSSSVDLNYTVIDSGSGVANCSYQLDSQPLQPEIYCDNVTLSDLSEGAHTVTLYSADYAGNANSSYVSFITDTLPPSVSIESPMNGAYNSTSVDLNYTVIDSGVGVANCSYMVDSDPAVQEPTCQNVTLSDMSQGIHAITVYSTDNVGNTNSTSTLLMIDSILPSVIISYPTNNSALDSFTITINLTSIDLNMDFTNISIYNSTGGIVNSTTNSTNGSISVQLSVTADGVYSINATAYDIVGNSNSDTSINITASTISSVYNFTVVPAIDSFSVANSTYIDRNYTLNNTGNQALSISCSTNVSWATNITDCPSALLANTSQDVTFRFNATGQPVGNQQVLLTFSSSGLTINATATAAISQSLSFCGSIASSGSYVLTTDISNTTATCLTITANNVTLDCNSYRITGGGSGYGVSISGRTNVTVKNCIVTNFSAGIYLSSSSNINLISNTANSNFAVGSSGSIRGYGIYLSSSNSNNLINNTASWNNATASSIANGYGYGIYLTASSSNNITNNTANSNNGTASSGVGYGYGIYLQSSSNNNNLINNTANSNNGGTTGGMPRGYGYGIYLTASSSNNITNNTARSNTARFTSGSSGQLYAYGIYLGSSSNNNILFNNNASSNNITTTASFMTAYVYGIYLTASSSNNITNNTANSNIGIASGTNGRGYVYGIYLSGGSSNIIANNTDSSNNGSGSSGSYSYGIFLTSSSSNNQFYNNFINETTPVSVSGGTGNVWNTTVNCTGPRNILNGSCIGGNFWAQPDGNGWSQIVASCNANYSGVCASPYPISGTSDYDYLPLASQAITPYPHSDCGSLSLPGLHILTQNVINGSTCFTVETDNVTLDCRGYNISFAQSSAGYGVNISGHTNTVIKNCKMGAAVSDSVGIYLSSSSYGNFTNNSISAGSAIVLNSSISNNSFTYNNLTATTGYGVSLTDGFNNTFANNSVTSASSSAVYLSSSPNNTLYNNTINGSIAVALYSSSSNNTFINNTLSSTGSYGAYLSSSSNNTFTNNTISNTGSYGAYFSGSSSNNFANNTITSTGDYGAYLTSSSDYNRFTNNLINGTTPVNVSSGTGNVWNTTLSCALSGVTNIVGGQCIGGNFYGTPTGTGYSETCSADSNGLCVSPYQIPGTGDYDNLTLSYLPQSLTGCGNLNKPNAVYTFAGSFSASGPICLNIAANNITLDCRGYTLSGNGNSYGIYTSGMSNLTIKNCILSSFTFTGIYLYSSNNDTISNVTSNSNGKSGPYGYTGAGIYIDKSNYSTIANTTTNSNYGNGGYGCQGFGIYLGNSNFNTITNATANSNHGGTQMSNYFGSGIHLSSSNSNRITNVTTVSNSMGGYVGYYGNNLLASGVYINGNNNTLSGAYADSSYSDGRSGYADGVYISGSNNTVSNFTARGTSANYYSYGVYISGSNNTVSNGIINSTTGNSASGTAYGVYLTSGGNNTITNITIGSDVGLGGNSSVYLISSSGNLFYNNLMNDTIPAITDTNSNSWNSSFNCGASNIVGGPCIGGNFWAQPDGNGWSQNSTNCNVNASRICTNPYSINTSNVDQLPLAPPS